MTSASSSEPRAEEVSQLSQMLKISPHEARELLRQHGNNSNRAIDAYMNGVPMKPLAQSDENDPELARALALSRESNTNQDQPPPLIGDEDPELQRAIAMSVQDRQVIDLTKEDSIGGEDAGMQQAIQASLAGSAKPSAEALRKQLRKPGLPAGLKNVGNTCYFNSLLQTYCMIPQFYNEIISFPDIEVSPTLSQRMQDILRFMKELQRLFARLRHTNQAWVDPSDFLKTIKNSNGTQYQLGSQEDVNEFNDLFLTTVAQGLHMQKQFRNNQQLSLDDSSDLTKSVSKEHAIQRLFYGREVEILEYQEADGTAGEVKTATKFNTLIVPVREEFESDIDSGETGSARCFNKLRALRYSLAHSRSPHWQVYMALDAYSTTVVDFTTPSGHHTKAQKVAWLAELPPVLFLLQNRVEFDPVTGSNRKIHSALQFPAELDMARYTLPHRPETVTIRRQVDELRVRLREEQGNMKALTNFKSRNHSLTEALASTLEYAKETGLPTEFIATLEEQLSAQTAVLAQWHETVNETRKKIEHSYDHVTGSPYRLFSLWVHQGGALGGHYWAFLDPALAAGWLRLNDQHVAPAADLEVWQEAVGGNLTQSSAYCLIYLNPSVLAEAPLATLPPHLADEIDKENAAFLTQLNPPAPVQGPAPAPPALTEAQTRSSTFLLALRSRLTQVEAEAQLRPGPGDRRTSVPVFLASIGAFRLLTAFVLKELWAIHFEKPIELALDDPRLQAVLTELGHLIDRNSEFLWRDLLSDILDGRLKPYEELVDHFRWTGYQLSQALVKWLDAREAGQWLFCFRQFAAALKADEPLQDFYRADMPRPLPPSLQSPSRRQQILTLLCAAASVYLDEETSRDVSAWSPEQARASLTLLRACTAFLCSSACFGPESNFAEEIQARVLTWAHGSLLPRCPAELEGFERSMEGFGRYQPVEHIQMKKFTREDTEILTQDLGTRLALVQQRYPTYIVAAEQEDL